MIGIFIGFAMVIAGFVLYVKGGLEFNLGAMFFGGGVAIAGFVVFVDHLAQVLL